MNNWVRRRKWEYLACHRKVEIRVPVTGCVFGGKLTALRYPEREFVSVPAKQTYFESKKPLAPSATFSLDAQQVYDELLSAEEVLGKRHIETRLMRHVTIHEENSVAALEVMRRSNWLSGYKWEWIVRTFGKNSIPTGFASMPS